LSGSIIKLSSNGVWGTAFATSAQGALVFHTAAHVLADLGFTAANQTKPIEMCDEQLVFLVDGPKVYDLTVTAYDPVCDVATFACGFPARPFTRSTHVAQPNDELRVVGYLPTGDVIVQPDCGVFLPLTGPVRAIGSLTNCARHCLLVDFRAPVPDLYGMSGGPVTLASAPTEVIGLLNGALHQEGGAPFIVSPI
jgi:hypothetical protein